MPGAGALERPDRPPFGTIVVIDPTVGARKQCDVVESEDPANPVLPQTLKSQKLTLENFKGPFSTHGISLYTPPSNADVIYIYAINHLPNPRWTLSSKTEEKVASQIELFMHTIGSKTARHLRSIVHPLIRTPNDLLAISEKEFLATNDHYYREGWMRTVEELVRYMSWTDLIHVRFDDQSVDAAVALDIIPTNNGLGWGPDRQVVIGDAAGGNVYFASLPSAENRTMTVSHHIPIDCVVDNANYFADPYAGVDGKDYSGYLMPGLADGTQFVRNYGDPEFKAPISGHVWYLPAIAGKNKDVDGKKLSKLIFKDNGYTIRSVTTAILVAIDPAKNGGKREGWLFVTSVIGAQMLATRIDFDTALV
ncbi:hypothetical protein RRF57_002714 [Xylaria bambusicola]|uniref:SMP-30/Gluconolactonase/LRE-like region domain-containing protein n=1 Tax=Xylaria bambusicola TaxID=326684 RepID=A0AAN7UJE9_9PEZI